MAMHPANSCVEKKKVLQILPLSFPLSKHMYTIAGSISLYWLQMKGPSRDTSRFVFDCYDHPSS